MTPLNTLFDVPTNAARYSAALTGVTASVAASHASFAVQSDNASDDQGATKLLQAYTTGSAHQTGLSGLRNRAVKVA